MSIFISVIIPVYNKEKHVVCAIRSVLSQSYKNFELIVIDDGSTDSSCKAVQKIATCTGCMRYIQQVNFGVSAARNKGAKEAKYNYLAFWDADDLWHHDYLKNIVMAFLAHPEARWVAANYTRFLDKEPILLRSDITLKPASFLYVDYFEESCLITGKQSIIHTDSFVVRRDFFFLCGGYPLGVQASEDYDLYFRLALHSDPLWTMEVLTFYREDAENQLSKMPINSVLPPYLTNFFPYSSEKHKFLKELRLRTLYNLLNKSIGFGGAGSYGKRFLYVKLLYFIFLSKGRFSLQRFSRNFLKALIFFVYPSFFKTKQ